MSGRAGLLIVALVTAVCTAAGDPARGAAPQAFQPASVTATGASTFWVLGAAWCGTRPCAAIARTTDGGRTFTRVGAPEAAVARGDATGASLTDLRMASTRDGWAYGGALYATHDGGATWRPLTGLGQVLRLETAGERAYAVLRDSRGYAVAVLSDVRTDRWRVRSLRWPTDRPTPDLAVQGSIALVWSGDGAGNGRMYVSTDGGASWRSSAAPGCLVARLSPGGGAYWMGCATGMMGQVLRSTDGLRWSPVRVDADIPNSVVVGARDASSAVVAACASLYVGGVTQGFRAVASPTAPGCGWRYLGFTTPLVGFALRTLPGPALYRTTDGGLRWTEVRF